MIADFVVLTSKLGASTKLTVHKTQTYGRADKTVRNVQKSISKMLSCSCNMGQANLWTRVVCYRGVIEVESEEEGQFGEQAGRGQYGAV